MWALLESMRRLSEKIASLKTQKHLEELNTDEPLEGGITPSSQRDLGTHANPV